MHEIGLIQNEVFELIQRNENLAPVENVEGFFQDACEILTGFIDFE
jgi:hypothetical protein